MKIVSFRQGLKETLFLDSTRPLRLMLSMVEWLFVVYLVSQASTPQFQIMLKVADANTWTALFLVNSFFLLAGLTGRYNRLTLFGEGVLGMCLWWMTAITNWAAQGLPGPTLICAICMTIILVNYPTHKRWGRND